MSRYALYFTPDPAESLWQFGSAVVGYDAATGKAPPSPEDPALRSLLLPEHRREPARYGFHATLKAPFALARDATVGDLTAAVEAFAARERPLSLGELTVTPIGAFLALMPNRTSLHVSAFAARCVREFDRFRAPLTGDERNRRLAAKLTARQIDYLDTWGYPYVMDEFRFHMTLTGPMPEEMRDPLRGALQELYTGISRPVSLNSITLLEQPGHDENFRILKTFAFPA